MRKTSFIYFDVAGTLLHKPDVFTAMLGVLSAHGININRAELFLRHKLLSEATKFPDKTSKDFYIDFNRELLRSCGLPGSQKLALELFEACKYKSWKAFEDTKIISRLPQHKGIISNWDDQINRHLQEAFPGMFETIVASMKEGVAKPDPAIYRIALEKVNVPADEVLYIGDSIKLDIEPTMELGMRALLIDRTGIYPSGGLPVIRSMQEIEQLI